VPGPRPCRGRLGPADAVRVRAASAHTIAHLASELHRLAPVCVRHAVAECNGEWREGARDRTRIADLPILDASIAKYGARLDKRIMRLNAELAPFDVRASRNGDPRGYVLKLYAIPGTAPLPGNDMGGGYGIG
jgi:hypothetical protein